MTIKNIYLNPICITLTNHSYLIFPIYSDRSLKQHHLHRTEKVQVVLRVQQQDPGISQDLIHPHDSLCRGVYPHSIGNDSPYPQ